MTVVGDGVETAEAQAALAELGCDLIQGYLIAKPLPLDELLAFLAQRPAAGLAPAAA